MTALGGLLLVCLLGLIFLPGKNAPAGVVTFTFALGLLGAWIAWAIAGPGHRRFLLAVFGVAFGLRLLWGFILLNFVPHLVQDHPYLSLGDLGDDGIGYDIFAWRGTEWWNTGHNPLDLYPVTNNKGYLLLLSSVYKLLGHEPYGVRALNSFLGALIPLFVFGIARSFLPARYARLSAGLAALYPGHILYSGTHLKDIALGAAFTASLWSIIQLRVRRGKLAIVGLGLLLVVSVAYLASSRSYYAGVVAGVFALFLVGEAVFGALRHGFSPRFIVVGLLMVAVLFTIEFVLKELRYARLWPIDQAFEQATAFYGGIVRPASSSSLYTLVEPPFTIVLLPVAALFTILNPFLLWPLVEPDPLYSILSPAIVAWYALIPLVIYGGVVALRDPRGRILVLAAIAILAVLAITGSGVQTTGRTKVPVEPLFLIFGAVGAIHFAERRPAVRAVVFFYALALLALVAAYLLAVERLFFQAMVFAVIPVLAIVLARQMLRSPSILGRLGRVLRI